MLVCSQTRREELSLDGALLHLADKCRGRVKFFKSEKGWRGIESDDTPMDVSVHFGAIDCTGYRSLTEGQHVVFEWEPAFHDSWRCVATWVQSLDGE